MELDIFVKNVSYSSTLQFCYVHITSCSVIELPVCIQITSSYFICKNVLLLSVLERTKKELCLSYHSFIWHLDA